jgi:peptidoglycan/LPS O-acetylase OafA/YrhL
VFRNKEMAQLAYRRDIDGLRAVSVLGVVVYHLGLGFPGGFVGVDVFFVISGFLITGIIRRQIQNDTFSLAQFWTRRIRRIVPAAFVMAFAVLVLGLIILTPEDLQKLAGASIWQALMASNMYFRLSINYFTPAAEDQALLHTWSLAIEEQFYLVLPTFLLLLKARLFRFAMPMIWLGAIASLALCVVWTSKNQTSAFYILPFRAWELLAGSLLAFHPPRKLSRGLSELIAGSGLALILFAMLAFDSLTPFPGYSALIPVLGAVLVLAGAQNESTLTSKILSCRVLVGIGLISYSLYLWHWPLIAFTRHVASELPFTGDGITLWQIGILLGSLGLGYASWRWVEIPFRTGVRWMRTAPSAFLTLGVAIVTICSLAALFLSESGFPQRFKTETLLLAQDHESTHKRWQGSAMPLDTFLPESERVSGRESPDVVLWGDSHGTVMADTMARLAHDRGLRGLAFFNPGAIPVTGVRTRADSKQQIQIAEKTLDSILNSGARNLILTSRWSRFLAGPNRFERSQGELPNSLLVSKPNSWSSDETEAAAILRVNLVAMLEQLHAAGIRVWILGSCPEVDVGHPARQLYAAERFGFVEPPPANGPDQTRFLQRHKLELEIMTDLPSDLATFVPVHPSIFSNREFVPIVQDGRSLYLDDDHLTPFGVSKLMRPSLARVFDQISNLP